MFEKSKELNVLLVEDSSLDAELIMANLSGMDRKIAYSVIDNAPAMREALAQTSWDIVLCDYSMPNFDPYSAMRIIHEYDSDIPFVVISGTIGEENIIKLMKMGCHDCVMKYNLGRLQSVVDRELKEAIIRKENKSFKEDLAKSEARFKAVFEQSPLGITLADSSTGKVYKTNSKFEDIIDRSFEELQHISWMELTHPEDLEKDVENMNMLRTGKIKSYNMNKRYIRKDQSEIWVNMTVASIDLHSEEACHLCMIEDITEKKKKEERIEYLIYHDVLTGLYNRTYFQDATEKLDNEQYLPLSYITGDINGLKLINDTLGHAQGDKLLMEMGKILTSCTKEKDVLARMGGDEFSILLPCTDEKEAQAILGCIYKACREYKDKSSRDVIYLSISLGCATKNSPDESFIETTKIAEDRMYKRKLLEHKSFHSSLIAYMRTTLFEKSNETEQHAERLVKMSHKLGLLMGLREEELSELELLSTLHDIGKISIDDHILSKPGALTADEWQQIRKHPVIGYRIAMASPELEPIADYILSHHERWDGKGYPQGLSGEGIPLLSRILFVVDAYDAMTENRIYRKAMSVYDALSEIEKNAGSQFDASIASLFIQMIRESGEM